MKSSRKSSFYMIIKIYMTKRNALLSRKVSTQINSSAGALMQAVVSSYRLRTKRMCTLHARTAALKFVSSVVKDGMKDRLATRLSQIH